MPREGGQNSYDTDVEPEREKPAESIALSLPRRQELQAASVPAINRVVFGAALKGNPNELWR